MIDLFSSLYSIERSMDYHMQRHAVLASNVANSETPGYRTRDIRFDSYLAQAERLRHTHRSHINAGGLEEFQVQVFDDDAAAGVDGNTVSMEREMAKISANSIRYRANTEIISRRLALLKYAANNGK